MSKFSHTFVSRAKLLASQLNALVTAHNDTDSKVEGIRQSVSAMPATLEDNHIYTITEAVSGDVTVPEPTASALGVTVLFTAGEVDSITFEGSPKWVNEVAGELTSGSMYLLTIIDGICSLNEIVEG